MRLSDLPRRMRRVFAWLRRRRPRYTPQTDVPLWRGTDMPDPPPCPGCAHGECLRACPPGTCGAIDDDEAARAALEPLDDDPPPSPWTAPARPEDTQGWAGGALLRLAQATDEDSARYWLAMYARRGADWSDVHEAWDEWQRQHRSNVHYLHTTDRPEEQHP